MCWWGLCDAEVECCVVVVSNQWWVQHGYAWISLLVVTFGMLHQECAEEMLRCYLEWGGDAVCCTVWCQDLSVAEGVLCHEELQWQALDGSQMPVSHQH